MDETAPVDVLLVQDSGDRLYAIPDPVLKTFLAPLQEFSSEERQALDDVLSAGPQGWRAVGRMEATYEPAPQMWGIADLPRVAMVEVVHVPEPTPTPTPTPTPPPKPKPGPPPPPSD